MKNAVDYSYARPSGAELQAKQLDALVYTGNARPEQEHVDDLRAHGVGITFIQETVSERALQGYQAGVYDAQFADARASQRGFPLEASISYVVSDSNRYNPSSGGDAIAEYGRGVADTSQRPFFFYGNRYAVDNALAGAQRSGNAHRSLGGWVPSTWDPHGGDLLIQEANVGSPVADSDLNTVQHAYGAWGGDAVTPSQPVEKKEHPDMFIGAKKRANSQQHDAAFVDGGFVIRWLNGDNQQPWGPYGLTLPQAAFDFAKDYELKVIPLDDNEWNAIEKRTWNSWQPLPAAGGGGGGAIDVAKLAAELAPALASHLEISAK